jgi:polyphosphate glucokinase
MKILVVDIGGNNVKLLATGRKQVRKFPSGRHLTPQELVKSVKAVAKGWDYDHLSIGYPGPVQHGQPLTEPFNLGRGWVGFTFDEHFDLPVRVINDAAMQALGSYEGGRMLFLGLGTGLGSALIVDYVIAPLELAHLPYRKGMTYEDYVGQRGMERLGKKKWRHFVEDVTARLRAAMVADYVVLGGGNAKKLHTLPANCRLGDNSKAFVGGFRLWRKEYTHVH